MLSGVDQIITSSNSFLNPFDRGAHLMKFGLVPTTDAIFIFTTTDSHRLHNTFSFFQKENLAGAKRKNISLVKFLKLSERKGLC